MNKVWDYECFDETISFAESLGWVDPLGDDATPSLIDETEGDALNFIQAKGYAIRVDGEIL